MKNKIILNENVSPRPMLKRSDKYSAKELSQKLLSTTYNGYNNSIEPLLIMGLAIMSPFRNLFIRETKGFTVAYLYGATSAGKSNLLDNIAFIFGYNGDEYVESGDSTVLSMWQNLDSCNSMPIIYDEISRKTLSDNLFEGFIKSAYQGTNRDKIANVKTAINASLIISSNFQPPQRPEILNRLLLCNFEQQNFKIDKIVEFNEVREKYLSNILPSILKQKSTDIINIFNSKKAYVKSINANIKNRPLNNIAIAYTGYQTLLNIAEETQPDNIRECLEYYIGNYDKTLKVETPWEEFLTALPLLARNKKIIANRDYKYAYDKPETKDTGDDLFGNPHLLCIHLEQAYKGFSEYYKQLKKDIPPTQKELLLYAKNDTNIHYGRTQITKGININGIKKRCLVIDIKDNYELSVLDKM